MTEALSPERIFEEKLKEGAVALGISLSGDVIDRILAHYGILVKWAPKMNLTTVLDPKKMAERLYLDSSILADKIDPQGSLIDVGTGAGFPGLILKAIHPGLKLVLLEARRKKISFLKNAAREMNLLDDIEFRWERLGWEEDESQQTFNEVVSRAAFPPAEWIKYGTKLVAPGGRLWIMSGQPSDEDQEQDFSAWIDQHVPQGFSLEYNGSYLLPFSRITRYLAAIRRNMT
jgi:16S rRNA (guanine527-N7)-methyltransferase